MKECITFKHVLNIDKYMCVCGERERNGLELEELGT